MKFTVGAALLVLFAASASGLTFLGRENDRQIALRQSDGPLTKITKLLQGMLDTSKAEGEEERKTYAKFTCWCDSNKDTLGSSIETIEGTTIPTLQNNIAKLQAENGVLSKECGKLDADKKQNLIDQQKHKDHCDGLRKTYKEKSDDLKAAIPQLAGAIEQLNEVNADQTESDGAADTKYYQAAGAKKAWDKKQGGKFLEMKSLVNSALETAAAIDVVLPSKIPRALEAFLQSSDPFTGTYTSQSAGVMGLLKEMKDKMSADLTELEKKNGRDEAFCSKRKGTLEKEWNDYDDMYIAKQRTLESNDGQLGADKMTLGLKETELANDKISFADVKAQCDKKAKEYDARQALRSNEEVAISEAISILSNDQAFATFGKTDATKIGGTSFLQISSGSDEVPVRAHAAAMLRGVPSIRITSAMVLLSTTSNPFVKVIEMMQGLRKVIEDEGKAEEEHLHWCIDERSTKDKEHFTATANIVAMEGEDGAGGKIYDFQEQIRQADRTIDQAKTDKSELAQQMAEALATRNQEKADFETKSQHSADAVRTIDNAITVLSKYYDEINPNPEMNVPVSGNTASDKVTKEAATWDTNSYSGQSGSGNKVIEMLKFVKAETKTEQGVDQFDEDESQRKYDLYVQTSQAEDAGHDKTITDTSADRAEDVKSLTQMQNDNKVEKETRKAIEDYLASIKDGCDFTEQNYDARVKARAAEDKALHDAIVYIKKTPVYMNAVANKHRESLGKCAGVCQDETHEEHAKCKACLAGVTVEGYCAGHADTDGC